MDHGAPPAYVQEAEPALVPRFTLIEGQYPQGAAMSAGVWAAARDPVRLAPGAVFELEIGLGGAAFAMGGGALKTGGGYEKLGAFGLEGVVLRTWPWWSPWVATNTTFAGARVFASYFALRCTLGIAWPIFADAAPGPIPLAGCGIGVL